MAVESELMVNLNFGKSMQEKGQISIWLDGYDDLFSDFDPRPYSKRALSDDFVFQIRKISKDHPKAGLTLVLLLPEKDRNAKNEEIIALRIHDYFSQAYQQLRLETNKLNKRGIQLTVAGIFLMIIASYISFNEPEVYLTYLLLTLFEPAGWFLFWYGLDQLLYGRDKRLKDLSFHAAIAGASIEFGKY
jgi:hypothetical protein